ncbi:MAG TPA: hypothetical protein DIS90_17085 [Cytophagales bacterium]|nr:hypothetical protein [Cytophagales bacterium]HRK83519.1 hypothetical protein [Saprospiraceae bacterium]
MKLTQFESKFKCFLDDLEKEGAPEMYWQRGYAMPKEIKEGALLFIGLNPSFPEEAKSGSHLYDLKQEDEGYFAKFGDIAKACGDTEWSHLDLLPIRHTQQKNIEIDVVFTHWKIVEGYLRTVSQVLLEDAKPKAVVVVNSTARLLLGKDQDEHAEKEQDKKIWMGLKFDFKESNGACYVTNSDKLEGVPFFFSGMLSGQRALDLGSYQRLKWHVAKVVQEI